MGLCREHISRLMRDGLGGRSVARNTRRRGAHRVRIGHRGVVHDHKTSRYIQGGIYSTKCPVCKREYVLDPYPGTIQLVDERERSTCPLGVPVKDASVYFNYLAARNQRRGDPATIRSFSVPTSPVRFPL